MTDEKKEGLFDNIETEDHKFLDKLADEIEGSGSLLWKKLRTEEIAKRLRVIAIDCDELAIHKERLRRLEERVDNALCASVELWLSDRLEDGGEEDLAHMVTAAIWLLARRTSTQIAKNAIGIGVGSLLGMMATGAGSRKRNPGGSHGGI